MVGLSVALLGSASLGIMPGALAQGPDLTGGVAGGAIGAAVAARAIRRRSGMVRRG